ncbi:replicative DNA helicase [Halobacillus sp. BBL2006]|uniref:replicative DNA helicase n=1 Tax=Halobacillus sp. BBL2006 TaxID=1543706 RepID=UPI00054300BD|nr:replicative DNA helicase [Halobacillus sp. BBL2006]KHE72640.1 DNA helicase [Halobacillus sp. BBL2006]
MIYNQEAEQSVIGTLLLKGELVKDVTLRSEHFCNHRHQMIYQAIQKIERAGDPVNIVSVTTELNHNIRAVGGVSYLTDLANSIPTTETLMHHQHLVLQSYRNRKTKEEASLYAQNPNGESLDQLMKQLEDFRSVGNVREEPTTNETLLEITREMQAPPTDGMTGFATGYQEVDQMTGGTQQGDLMIIAGRPSMGKTAFALNLAAQHCKRGGSAHIFSLEMGRKSIFKRILSCEAEVDGQKWRTLNFSRIDYENCFTAIGEVSEWNLHVYEQARTVADIRAQVRQSIRKDKEPKPLIVIDYLQLLVPVGRYERRDLEVGAMTRELKLLARELDVPIILLSQLSRGVEQRKDKRPMMADLRESGNIEQDADVIGLLYREEYYRRGDGENNEVELIISKQRNGPVGSVKLAFLKEYGKFVNV